MVNTAGSEKIRMRFYTGFIRYQSTSKYHSETIVQVPDPGVAPAMNFLLELEEI